MKIVDRILQGKAHIGSFGYYLCAKVFTTVTGHQDKKRLKSQEEDTSDLTILKNIPYLEDKKKEHLLDIYMPKGKEKEKLPLLFDSHGGGFMYGDKSLNRHSATALARLGYKVVLYSYSLAPRVTLYDQIREAYSCLAYLERNANHYAFDVDHIYFLGDSAGGMISFSLASILKSPTLQKVFGVEPLPYLPKAVGLFSTMSKMKRDDSLGGVPYRNTVPEKRCSKLACYPYLLYPYSMVTADTYVPCFLATSEDDMFKLDSLFFTTYLDTLPVTYELNKYPKNKDHEVPHVFPIVYPKLEESVDTYKKLDRFFKKNA